MRRSETKVLTTHVGSLPYLRSHPQIAWAKLHVLVEGARRATQALG
jgi:hypothetical protein